MPNKNKSFLIIILLLGLVVNALTATGKIQYNGRLLEEGKPVNGNKTMVFTLYDAEIGGSILWQSGVERIIVKKGEFSYVIGKKPALPGEIFDGRDVYLEIAIEGDILEPREELLKVPYAAYAAAAGSAKNWKASVDGVYYDSGHVGIGTDKMDMPLRVVGSYPDKHSAGFEGLSGHGVAIGGYGYTLEGRIQGYVKDAAGNDNPSNIRINVNGGNVGVGDVTVDEKLVVDGNIKAAGFIGDGSGLTNVAVTETDPKFSTSAAAGITNAGSGKVISFEERVKLINAITSESDPSFTTSEAANITDAGSGEVITTQERVNIGVALSSGTAAYSWRDHGDAGYLTSYTETDPQVNVSEVNAVGKWNGSSLVGGGLYEKDGNVGIGTVAPISKLEIAGTVKATEFISERAISLGNTTSTIPGTIRWNGIDFEGYTGTEWISLTRSSSTMGENPCFKVKKSNNQSILGNNNYIKLTWDIVDFDVNNDFDITNNRFIPKKPGKYSITAYAIFLFNSNRVRCLKLCIAKNGNVNTVRNRVDMSADIRNEHLGISTILEANGETDYFEVYAAQNDTSDDAEIAYEPYYTYFTGYKVSD